jgi:hypothetical protein
MRLETDLSRAWRPGLTAFCYEGSSAGPKYAALVHVFFQRVAERFILLVRYPKPSHHYLLGKSRAKT